MVRGPTLQQSVGMVAPVKSAAPVRKIPTRAEVSAGDTWDLSPLYVDEAAWEKGLEELKGQRGVMGRWKGKLGEAESLVEAQIGRAHV